MLAGDECDVDGDGLWYACPTYQWRRNSININGATGSSYTINAVSGSIAGTYTVVATNGGGAVTSSVAILAVGGNTALDFNGDGRQDILWHNPVSGDYGIWLMDGSNIIGGANLQRRRGWDIAGVADFSGDGNDDILWRNPPPAK